jgi:hypothetical protein
LSTKKNPAGTYEVEFTALQSASGELPVLPNVVYFLRLQAVSLRETKKMILMQ